VSKHVFGPESNTPTKTDWGTPQDLFDAVNAEFHFVLDAAAHEGNAKCEAYYCKDMNSKILPWWCHGGNVWLNPPYGRGVGEWVEKAYLESLHGITVVVLVFVRSDTKWWASWAMRADEVRLIRGRVKFQGAENSAPAPSCLLVFRGARQHPPRFSVIEVPRR
jgi:phage N-6-adenine-methyltransferase